MQIVIDIHKNWEERIESMSDSEIAEYLYNVIRNNSMPLPKMKDELICKILMEVDGGTDDKYLNYLDICERIEQSINEYFEEVKNNANRN